MSEIECDSCGYPTSDLIECEYGYAQPLTNAHLCKICYNTPVNSAHFWPKDHLDNKDILKTIAYIGNLLLAAIEVKERK